MSDLPPPNIASDVLLIYTNSAIIPVADPFVPSSLGCNAKVVKYGPDGENSAIALTCGGDFVVGTVAELVEQFREKITRAFHVMALTPSDGSEQPVIPCFEEPSFRKQTELLRSAFPERVGAISIPGGTRVPAASWAAEKAE